MSLAEKVLSIKGKHDAEHLLHIVQSDSDALVELMECFFSEDWVLCQKAAWIVGKLGEKKQELLQPYLDKMVKVLHSSPHDAMLRNTVRSLQFVELDDKYEGEVFELCYNFIADPKYAAAIRAFSMTVCFNIAKKYPELLVELEGLLQLCYQEEGKAIISRSRQLLKKIEKMK